jgi:Ca-activated chloride channel family protein
MIRFQHTTYLYALGLIPVLVLVYWLFRRWRRRALATFGDTVIIQQLFPDVSPSKPRWKMIVSVLAYAFFIVALANPQLGTKLEEVKREGVNIVIALDVSNSMRAEDLKPNRLERAKQAIAKLTEKLSNDRIGLVIFAGEAFLQLPLTGDYSAVKMFLGAIEPGAIPTQGTAIGAAIQAAGKAFAGVEELQNEQRYKVLILITDGENHEDDAIAAAQELHKTGVVVHAIGMGSPEGAPIPVYANGISAGYRKDRSGNIVITKLDETGLQRIAAAGGGIYVRANNTEAGLNIVMDEIGKMEKKEFGSKVFTNYEDRFQYPLLIAFVLMLLELLLSERRTRWLMRLNLFGDTTNTTSSAATMLVVLIAMLVVHSVYTAIPAHAQALHTTPPSTAEQWFTSPRSLAREGNTAYQQGKYDEASVNYRASLERDKTFTEGIFNLGDALYKQGKYDEAADQFRLAAMQKHIEKELLAKSYHNLGNAMVKTNKLQEAVDAYKRALKANPNDDETRHNLSYALMKLQQQQQQSQQQQNQQQQQQQQSQQQQNQQQQQAQSAQQKPSLSKVDAERILEALNNEEKNVQKKLIKKKVVPVIIEKDW